MRHVPLSDLIKKMLTDPVTAKKSAQLSKSLAKVTKMLPRLRHGYIRRNGPRKWSPIKLWLTKHLGKKCWYTEAELVGAPLSIDHYRPVSKYWWLAFSVENYRVACAFANSPEHNAEHGCAGGKGDAFPLLAPARRATWSNKNRRELPVILDPCNKDDCDLIAFEADGRPVINPLHAKDPVARMRVDESKILLNLDHSDFNAKREQLCAGIADSVKIYEALPMGSPERDIVLNGLARKLNSQAPFSSAARHYLQFHRHLKWVDELLAKVK